MDFSAALDLLKQGRKFYRQQWATSGQDQWVVQQTGYPQGIPLNRNTAQATGLPEGSTQIVEPYFMMYTPWSTFTQWTPSATDLLADDWEAYYFPGEEERLRQEETDAILADPELVAELEAAGEDPRTYSHDEIKMALSLRKLENEELPDREAIRFRLVRQLLKPVIDRQREIDPPLIVDTDHPVRAEDIYVFVGVIRKLQDDLDRAEKLGLEAGFQNHGVAEALAEAKPGWWEEEGAHMPPGDAVRLLARERDEARADLAATELGSLMVGAGEFERLAIALIPTLATWRQDVGPVIDTDAWAFTINGRREAGLGDRVTTVTMELRDAAAVEAETRMVEIVAKASDPERTQELVRPGDPGYPTRPQRLTEAMRLRQSFPDGHTETVLSEPPQQP